MDENGIKAAVLTHIRRQKRGRPLPIIANEFSLNGTGIRADLAVLDDCFLGIEIKSASDTLKRLPNQMEGYARYFDRTELVVAAKHRRGLEDINLQYATVWSIEPDGEWDLVRVGDERRISGHWLLQLLTVAEERRAVKAASDQLGMEQQTVLDAAFRSEFVAAFRRRYEKTSTAFWNAVRGRSIKASDLVLLSRFHEERERAKSLEAENEAMWTVWKEQMNAIAARF